MIKCGGCGRIYDRDGVVMCEDESGEIKWICWSCIDRIHNRKCRNREICSKRYILDKSEIKELYR